MEKSVRTIDVFFKLTQASTLPLDCAMSNSTSLSTGGRADKTESKNRVLGCFFLNIFPLSIALVVILSVAIIVVRGDSLTFHVSVHSALHFASHLVLHLAFHLALHIANDLMLYLG